MKDISIDADVVWPVCIAAVLITLIITIGWDSYQRGEQKKYIKTEEIKAGASALEIACADSRGSTNIAAPCVALIVGERK